MTSQVQRSAAAGGADLRSGPAQGLFEQPEGVLEVETTQKRLPPAVHMGRAGVGDGGPQPDGFGVAVAGQVLDLQPDECAFDDR
jgi:hypothetical protein